MSRLTALSALVLTAACTAGEAPPDESSAVEEVTADAPMVVEGFAESEAVRHDPTADVYLVANINGDPTEKDDNGFIARVSPDGEITDLRWIDGEAGDFELNAPKGMAIKGDTLFVADIDVVRAFDRESGAHIEDRPVDGAQFLNDIAIDGAGSLWVTDTFRMSLHRMDGMSAETIVEGEDFGQPNGVDIHGDGLAVLLWGGGTKHVDPTTGAVGDMPAPEGEQLDGIVMMDDGSYLVSSWDLVGVVRVASDGTVTEVAGDIPEAADIGFDFARNRLLVPTFGNVLHIIPLG